MSTLPNPGANLYTQGTGTRPENIEIPVFQNRAPTTTDVIYPVGKRWIFINSGEYTLLALTSIGGTLTANWSQLGTSGGGAINTLTGDSGGAISPSANNINLNGTASQIVSTGSGSSIVWSLSSSLVAPGSLTVTGLLTGNASATINTAGTALNLATDNDGSAVNIGNGTIGRTISIGTSAAANLITIGSVTGASSLSLLLGTGNFVLNGNAASTYTIGAATTTGTMTIGGTAQTGTITLGSSSGTNTVAIGAGAGATTVNIANGITGNTISIGNGANTSAQTINIADGATGANSTVNVLSGAGTAGTQTFNLLATGATRAGAVNIATGAAAHVVTIGQVTTTIALNGPTTLTLASGAATGLVVTTAAGTGVGATIASSSATVDALQLTGGGIKLAPVIVAAGASPLTANGRFSQVTFSGVSIASGATQTFVINNSVVTGAATVIDLKWFGATAGSGLSIVSITPSAGSISIVMTNATSATMVTSAANITFNVWVQN